MKAGLESDRLVKFSHLVGVSHGEERSEYYRYEFVRDGLERGFSECICSAQIYYVLRLGIRHGGTVIPTVKECPPHTTVQPNTENKQSKQKQKGRKVTCGIGQGTQPDR